MQLSWSRVDGEERCGFYRVRENPHTGSFTVAIVTPATEAGDAFVAQGCPCLGFRATYRTRERALAGVERHVAYHFAHDLLIRTLSPMSAAGRRRLHKDLRRSLRAATLSGSRTNVLVARRALFNLRTTRKRKKTT